MLALPRSVRLATWATTWLHGQATADDVAARVRGTDEPHEVEGLPTGSPAPLADGLQALRTAGARALTVALPRPGDPQGLAGPPALTEAAVEAGEAVLAVGANHALVPRVTPFGPPGDEGHFVTWVWHEAEPPPPGPALADADRSLNEALLHASSTLAELDVAAWRPEVARLLEDVRARRGAAPLPHGYPPPAQALAARAARLWAVAEFALGDDGAAVTATEAGTRRTVLRELEREARHALATACNAVALA